MRTIGRAWMWSSAVFLAASWSAADVTLRIVTYNVTSSAGSPRPGMDTILQAIGNEAVGGRIQPLDVIAMQEVQSQATTGQDFVTILNALYGAGVYARGSVDGVSTGAGTQGVVYNTTKLQLVSELALGATGGAVQPRQTIRHRFHPVAVTGAGADFYVYNGHWKAGDDATSEGRRQIEANVIRVDADALGQGAAIIFTGDFNLYRSTDTSFQRIIAAGNAQGFDPINRIGAWHDTASFADVFTQAPAVSPPGGLTGGGLDDRFDWQMVTGEVLAGTPSVLTYIAGSYHTFGNNGSVALNGNINDASNTALPGLANRVTVLNLLTTVSDHLPVVADYIITTPGGTGACCVFTACSITTQAGCTGGGSFKGVNSVCAAPGNPVTCCPANFNQTNGLSVQDIFDFLAAYFAGDIRADFNTSGAISVQDTFDFLAAYFAGCP